LKFNFYIIATVNWYRSRS